MPTKKPPRKLIHEFIDLAHEDKNLPEVKRLLGEYPDLLNIARPGKDKETAMGAATHSFAKKMIQFLLDEGVELDIFTACALGKTKLVKEAIEANPYLVKAKAKHAHDMDLVDFARTKTMFNMLLKNGYPMTIFTAAGKGLIDQIDKFLKEDPSLLEAKKDEKETPLFHAIWGEQDKAALHLIKLGCEIDVPNDVGPPLTYACIWGRDKVVKKLLALGADPHVKFLGMTYLHAAVDWEMGGDKANCRIIKMLIDAGVKPKLKNKKKQTAYDVAVEKGLDEQAVLIQQLGG